MKKVVALFGALVVASLAGPGSASATTIQVTNLSNSGNGSLRSAIQLANITQARDEIRFASGVSGTATFTSALPNITEPLDIVGPGAGSITLRYSGASGPMFFWVSNTGAASVSGLTISDSDGLRVNTGSPLSVSRVAIVDGGKAVDAASELEIDRSTVAANTASDSVVLAFNDALITNSTVTGNSTTDPARSGGLEFRFADSTVANSTIAGNSAPSGSGADNILAFNNAAVFVRSSILETAAGGAPSCAKSSNSLIASRDFNIDDGTSCGFDRSGDKNSTEPLLLPLGDYEGPTDTMAITRFSPAVDAGDNSLNLSTDQRGFPRTQNSPGISAAAGGDGTDVGAFERRSTIVNNTDNGGFGSLRSAVGVANSEPGYDLVAFVSGLTGRINLESALPALSSMEIAGPGANKLTVARLSTAPQFRIFNQSTPFGLLSTLPRISGLTIAGGSTTGEGGGILVGEDAKLELNGVYLDGNESSGAGGGISVQGDLTMSRSTVENSDSSSATGAAGIHVAGTGTADIDSSTISRNNNSAAGAGNIRAATGSEVEITNSTIALGQSNGGVAGLSGTTATVSIGNSIVTSTQTICGGAVTSLGHNLDSGTTCGFNATGDIQNGNADLGFLQVGSSPTPTFPLGLASDAIDAGKALEGQTTDQRGLTRPVDFTGVPATATSDNSDIGAYERQNGDTDGDGITDGLDKCFSVAGDGESGCPTAARTLTLKLKKPKTFKGKLAAPTKQACSQDQKVTILRVQGSKAKKVAKGKTKASGAFKAKAKKTPAKGRYVARVKTKVLPSPVSAECLPAESAALKVK